MADSNTLKVMSIFESGARLEYGSELTCLAAHIYHRFFRVQQQQTSMFDLYMFASASLMIAHWFYERDFDPQDLCLVMCDLIHGEDFVVTKEISQSLTHSMELAAKIICTNLEYQVTFKDTRLTTPGLLQQQYKDRQAEMAANARNPMLVDLEPKESSSSDDETTNETKADRLLSKNDRYKISGHRYLLHYLKTIKELVDPEAMEYFVKISNVAWIFLCDYHWSPCVTQILSNHLACTCLIMAIEVFRPQLENSKVEERRTLWETLDQKWNYIMCDDLDEKHLQRAINLVVEQYDEYDRILQHELNTYVIDPSKS